MGERRSRRQLLTAAVGAAAAGAMCGSVASDLAGRRELTDPVGPFGMSNVRNKQFSGGAAGNGTTDDTAAINAALQQSPYGAIYFPEGTYSVKADPSTGVAIRLDRASARIVLAPGAVIRLVANDREIYAMVRVTAADCVIEGGQWMGDVETHKGNAGEWGHCIHIAGGADRCIIRNTTVGRAWGDGIFVNGHPADISIENVVAIENRRQGMSITDALRPRVVGGRFAATGSIRYTAPGSGIDIEPDAGVGTVIDASLSNVLLEGNRGAGIIASSNGQLLSASLQGCKSAGNGGDGFWAMGSNSSTTLVGCTAIKNAGSGFAVSIAPGVNLTGCKATENANHGFILDGPTAILTGCDATGNDYAGYYLLSGCNSSALTACTATANAHSDHRFPQIDVTAQNVRMTNVVSDASRGSIPPSYGYAIRPGARRCVLVSCSAVGKFERGPWIDMAPNTIALPIPGGARPVIYGSRAGESASTTSMREALISLGLVTDQTVP